MATSTSAKLPVPPRTRYEDDLYTWVEEQVELLRAGRLSEIDALNLAEELSDVGNAQLDKLESSIALLTQHILKWEHQPERRTVSWQASVSEQRRRIVRVLKKNPGLKSKLVEALQEGYADGRDRAVAETTLPYAHFPEQCPYTFDEMMTRPIVYEPKPASRRKKR